MQDAADSAKCVESHVTIPYDVIHCLLFICEVYLISEE